MEGTADFAGMYKRTGDFFIHRNCNRSVQQRMLCACSLSSIMSLQKVPSRHVHRSKRTSRPGLISMVYAKCQLPQVAKCDIALRGNARSELLLSQIDDLGLPLLLTLTHLDVFVAFTFDSTVRSLGLLHTVSDGTVLRRYATHHVMSKQC
jgi:hypothetical protein